MAGAPHGSFMRGSGTSGLRTAAPLCANLRRPATATALPVYLQQRKCLIGGQHRRSVPEGDIGSATSSRVKELHPLWASSQ
jgi:hypothetical protein